MLFQLLYSSVAMVPFDQTGLLALLDRARDFNDRHHITGALLYFEESREFFQILEGEEAEVRALMTRIREDRRHHGVLVAHEGPLAARSFVNWSMGFRLLDGAAARCHLGYAPTLQEGLAAAPVTGRPSMSMQLLEFMRQSVQTA